MNTSTQSPRSTGGATTAVLLTAGLLMLVGSLGAGTATVIAPDKVEAVYGSVKTVVTETTTTVREEATGQLPTVKLGGSGGQAELDVCDGAFTRMTSYQSTDFTTPVWAAHNACGGDAILGWVEGQQVRVIGNDGVYKVVDSLTLSKTWSSTADIAELKGDLILQTCFYGSEEMRFVSLKSIT